MYSTRNPVQKTWWSSPLPLACLAVFAAWNFLAGSVVQAAGCAHRTENVSIGLDPFGNPLANNVLKVYNGGEFHYYILPEGKPCNGPNCKGAPPKNLSAIPPLITTERCDLTFFKNNECVGTLLYCSQFVFWPSYRPASPVLDGLLRPPTV
jgi:hypothetical protein